eukprot:4582025-Pleurochrysis_carterae.AAC.1
MNDEQNTEGVEQADKAIRAIERLRRGHMNLNNKEEEESAPRQMTSGIIYRNGRKLTRKRRKER